jgi:hypothetical protein
MRNDIQKGFQKPHPFFNPSMPMPIEVIVIAAAIDNVSISMTQ